MEIILEVFKNYGWFGIIGILCAMSLYICLKKYSKKISKDMETGLEKVGEKLTDQMSKQNDKLLDAIVAQQDKLVDHIIAKEHDDINNHNNMVEERMNLSDSVNMELKDIMQVHGAQRAFILEFHNSFSNLSGTPFAKYSCNFEWFDKGLMPISYKCMGLPFSSLAKIVQDIINSDTQQVIYDDMNKMYDENPSLMSLLQDPKITGFVYTGMYDKNNLLVGLLVLEYHTEFNPNKINLNQLNIQSAELTSVLNIRYKYSK